MSWYGQFGRLLEQAYNGTAPKRRAWPVRQCSEIRRTPVGRAAGVGMCAAANSEPIHPAARSASPGIGLNAKSISLQQQVRGAIATGAWGVKD